MPTASSSMAAMLTEMLHRPESVTGTQVSVGFTRWPMSSFYNVNCHEGFKCISKVDTFGRNHDGVYKTREENKTIPSDFRGTYEEGCPAKGELTESGECLDFRKGRGESMCWSRNRYEGGREGPCPTTADCMCVKSTADGDKKMNHKYAVHKAGLEKQMQLYWVQSQQDCDSCEAFTNQQACERCRDCMFTVKEIVGKKVEGCFQRNPFRPRPSPPGDSEPGRVYLKGVDSRPPEDYVVLPHYPLWDPGDKGPATFPDMVYKMPFQSKREPLSREGWLEKYKLAAPRIQRFMDKTAIKAKRYQPNMETGVCPTAKLGCLHNIGIKIEQIEAAQGACQGMQTTEMQIREGGPTGFKSKSGKHAVNCRAGGGGMCQRLNCYSSDRKVMGGLKCLRKRLKACLPEIRAADERIKNIENGLIPHRPDEDLERAPLEPDGPRRKFPPRAGASDETPPPEPPPANGSTTEMSETSEEAKEFEQKAEKAFENMERQEYAAGEAAVNAMPKDQLMAAEQAVEHSPETYKALRREQAEFEAPPREPGRPSQRKAAEAQERAGEDALAHMDKKKLMAEAERRATSDPDLLIRQQQSDDMLNKIKHDPKLRKDADLNQDSLEGLVVAVSAIWTAVGAAVTTVNRLPAAKQRTCARHDPHQDKAFREFLCSLRA